MRNFTAMLTAGLLSLATPIADAAESAGPAGSSQPSGPLKPGRSAGVRAAQLPRMGLALVGASAFIAVVVVAVGTGSSNGNGPQTNLQSVPSTMAP